MSIGGTASYLSVLEVLTRVKHKYLLERYKLPSDTEPWEDHEEFLKVLAIKMGKLRKVQDSGLID